MKTWKQYTVMAFMAISIFFVFVGCGPGADGDLDDILDPIIPGERVSITVELFDRGTDGGKTQADDNAWTKWIKEKVLKDFNIDVTFVPIGRWTENNDIIGRMAAGNAPDLCYTYNGGVIGNLASEGKILDLAPYVSRLPVDLDTLFGDDPAFPDKDFILRYMRADGKMYSLPSYRVNVAMRNVFIRKDWLDTLGLALPTTTEEFHQALIAFRDQDPGGVGKSNVVPYGQDLDARWGFANIAESFIDPNLTNAERYYYTIADRKIYMPGYKEGMRELNKWYNEGLIKKNFQDTAVVDYALIKTGVVGAFSGNWDLPYRTEFNILSDLQAAVLDANFVPVDCFKDANGVTTKDLYDKAGLQIFVPSFSKEPEAALLYLCWLAIPENYKFLQIGEEDVNHTIVDGVPAMKNPPPNDPWFMNSANNIDFTMPMNGVEMGSPELNARVLALGYPGFTADVIVNAYNLSITNARTPVGAKAPTTKNGTFGKTLQDKADALIANAVTAPVENFDSVWDAGITDWLASGGQAVFDERKAIAADEGL